MLEGAPGSRFLTLKLGRGTRSWRGAQLTPPKPQLHRCLLFGLLACRVRRGAWPTPSAGGFEGATWKLGNPGDHFPRGLWEGVQGASPELPLGPWEPEGLVPTPVGKTLPGVPHLAPG